MGFFFAKKHSLKIGQAFTVTGYFFPSRVDLQDILFSVVRLNVEVYLISTVIMIQPVSGELLDF